MWKTGAISRRVRPHITTLTAVSFAPLFCYTISVRPKCSSQQLVLRLFYRKTENSHNNIIYSKVDYKNDSTILYIPV
jgi:hypothetical protein